MNKASISQSGQAMVETAFTLLFMMPIIFLMIQLSYWIFASAIIHTSVLSAVQAGAQSGNPDFVDRVLKHDLRYLAKDVPNSQMNIKYITNKDGDFFTNPVEWKVTNSGCGDHGRWNQNKGNYGCVWKKSDGALLVSVEYILPLNLTFGWFRVIRAEGVSYIECVPTEKINDDINDPFCKKFF